MNIFWGGLIVCLVLIIAFAIHWALGFLLIVLGIISLTN